MTRSRWTIPLILAVTVFVHYLDRNNLAIVLPQIAREFGWDDPQIGQHGNLLLGAFYLNFGIAQVILSPPPTPSGCACCWARQRACICR